MMCRYSLKPNYISRREFSLKHYVLMKDDKISFTKNYEVIYLQDVN